MDTIDVIAILALVVFGVVAGFFVSKHSQRRKPILGGPVARALNYAASALLISLAPTTCVMVTIVHPTAVYIGETRIPPFIPLIGLLLGMMGLALLLLIPYAIVEPATKPNVDDDRGWTEQDARSSGL